jgi:sialate O-acetylesterase
VGYHFARLVTAITGVPIGLIDNSWGGSVVETWVSRESLEQIPEAQPLIVQFDAEAAAYNHEAELARKMTGWKNQAAKAEAAGNKAPEKPDVPKTYTYRQSYPGGCFNGLIAPIQKFAIKGAIFYQGENNCVAGQARPNLYQKTFSALIPDWRKAFDDPELPFCIVQLCSFGGPDDENEPEINMLHRATGVREAQLKAHLKYKNTGIVPTFDLGHVQMHSPFKRPIGERAARWALATVYQIKGITYDIPIMESWKKDGQRILLTFTPGSHPSSPYGMRVPPKGFVIAGKDRHFYPASVDNEKGDTFSVTSEWVPDPVAVRYAWGVHPLGNFGNRAAPTPPFRTDDWPAWNDAPIGPKGSPEKLDPEVPTKETADAQARIRKAAAARKVLADLDAPQKKSKPARN